MSKPTGNPPGMPRGRPKGFSPKKLEREKLLSPDTVENMRQKLIAGAEYPQPKARPKITPADVLEAREREQEEAPPVMNEQTGPRRIIPESELELNYYFTTPEWGDETVSQDLQENFTKHKIVKVPRGRIFKGPDGREYVSDGTAEEAEVRNYWAKNLSFLRRDIRLANYDPKKYNYCAYYYELGGAMLNEGFPEAASVCIQLAAIHGEMSQGVNGFLRKIQQTLIRKDEVTTQERKNSILNPRNRDDGY